MKAFPLIGALTALLLSCFPNRTAAQFAYGPSSPGARGFFDGFKTDQSGNFTPLAGSPFGVKARLVSLTRSPFTYIYSYYFPTRNSGRIQGFQIGVNGKPTPIGTRLNYTPPMTPGSNTVSSFGLITGPYIYILDTTTDNEGFGATTQLAVVRVKPTGSPTFNPKEVYPFGHGIQMMIGNSSQTLIFGEDNSNVLGYSVATDGSLQPIAGPQLPGPWSIGFGPDSKYFYEFFAPQAGNPLELAVFAVGNDGSLTPIAGSPFKDSNGGFNVTNPLILHPSGKYLYALGFLPGSASGPLANIYAYSVSTNGQLQPLAGSPYNLPSAEVIAPELTMTMDLGGNFLTISNPTDTNVTRPNWVYLIESDGTLVQRANSPSVTIPAIDCFAQ